MSYSMYVNNIICRIILYIFTRKGAKGMVFNTGAALLDAIVLAVVAKEPEGAYGYNITQDVRQIITDSEYTL